MLVLSRNKNQKINFPGLGISVEILEIQSGKVRVGVEAPIEVRILRDELEDRHAGKPVTKPQVIHLPQALRHEFRNTLNELSLMLHVYQKRNEQIGLNDLSERLDAEQMFEAILQRFNDLSSHSVFQKSGFLVGGAEKSHAKLGTALVVDDDDNERELLAGFLRMCGYQVATACDGVNAIEYLQDNPTPAFVLLDMQMPRCDGAKFLEQIQQSEAWRKMHVFVVSGSSPEECELPAGQTFTKWLNKPLDPRLVVEELQNIDSKRPREAALH